MKCAFKHCDNTAARKGSYCPNCRERLERGGGSGAIACCADAERAHEQERRDSREDSPGCAGVGEAELLELADEWSRREYKHREIMLEFSKAGKRDKAELWRRQANEIANCRKRLLSLLPKPDSEARNERSGRRNATSEGSPPSQLENKQERNGDSIH